MASSLPAWPFLVAALGSFLVGLLLINLSGLGFVGWGLLVLVAPLAWMGVQRGRKALAAADAAPTAAADSGDEPSTKKEKTVGDYTSVKAVQSAMETPKKRCPECHSPVAEWQKECPTCSSPLSS